MNIKDNSKKEHMKNSQHKIIIGGSTVIKAFNIFTYGVITVVIGYLVGRYASGNPVDIVAVFNQLFPVK